MVKDLVNGKEWKEPVRFDLGCGPWIREGFIGIDIRNFWEGNKIKDYEVKADIFYDLFPQEFIKPNKLTNLELN